MTGSLRSGAQPLIVIGAARSGTNMLRDLLTAIPGFATWPCDEINPIWRHGSRAHPDDELSPEHANPSVRRYIRGRFDRVARRYRAGVVVEKTCANSLRVAFVDRVLPDARFVVIERDGYDVVASALRRWRAPIDVQYTLRKAKFVPVADLPQWGWRFLRPRLGPDGLPPSWGPRFAGMDAALRTHTLPSVAALQWARSVTRSRADLAALAPARVYRLSYEGLVSRPEGEIGRLLDWCGVEPVSELVGRLAAGVHSDRVGRGRERLGERAVADIAPIVARLACVP